MKIKFISDLKAKDPIELWYGWQFRTMQKGELGDY